MAAAAVTAAGYIGTFVSTYGSAIAAVAAVGSAAVSYKQSQDKKDAAEAYNKQLQEEAIRQYGELDAAEADAIQESHAQSMQAQRELLQARSNVQLQAAVSGTYGNSVNVAIQDLNTGFGGRMAEITYNRDSQLDEINKTAERIAASTSLNTDTSIQMPSYYKAFSSGMSTYGAMEGITSKVANAYSQVKPATS